MSLGNLKQKLIEKICNNRIRRYYVNRARDKSSKYVLSKEDEKEALDFFKRLTHKRISLAFHNFYTENTGKFNKEYIPEDLYFIYIDKFYNDQKQSKVFSNKCLVDVFFPGLNMPKPIAKRINGFWYIDEEIVEFEKVVDRIKTYPEAFVKAAENSYGGKGVVCILVEEGDMVKQFTTAVDKINVDIIVQEAFKQHDSLSRVNSSSVNTLRVMSMLKKDGSVRIYSCFLRMGVAGSRVDNATSGGVSCGVNMDGSCKEEGHYSYYNEGKTVFIHPTSGIPFCSVVIPNFKKVIDFVESAHKRIPHFRLVSWDIAIDEFGEPALIEINLLKSGITLHQLDNGPLFKEDTEEVLREVFGNC